MADRSIENKCGCLYFYGKKGISQPCYLTRGKTTLGSSVQCHIRVKGVENIFCILDSNDAGFTVLVNEYEDERILVNGTYAQKYTVLTHEDHFQLGDKTFKYYKPDINEKDLESLQNIVANRMLIGNFKRRSVRNSTVVSPLKRLERPSPKMRRFSTGSRISEIKGFRAVAGRNTLLSVRSSTPRSNSKTRLSQKIIRPRHSALGALKENEMLEFLKPTLSFVEGPVNVDKVFSKTDDASKPEFKSPTPKKNLPTTGNLKELDLNSTVSSCCSPVLTRRKLYSGNLSDVSDFTTPENNISAVSITPLNVSKKTNKSLNKSKNSFAYDNLLAESSTPKSALRGRRSSAIYRPIVEQITPVSPAPRSSLRISSLKKPSFTQRRSVNFNISSSSENSAFDSNSTGKEESFKKGAKRKRSISDISGPSYKKKIVKYYTPKKKMDSGSDAESESQQNVNTSQGENNATKSSRYENLSPDTAVAESDNETDINDSDDISVAFSLVDASGRNVVDNSYLGTLAPTIANDTSDRKTSAAPARKSNAIDCSVKELGPETSKRRTRNSLKHMNSSFDVSPSSSWRSETDYNEIAASFDDEAFPRSSVFDDGNSHGASSKRNSCSDAVSSFTPKMPKSSQRKSIKTPRSDERDYAVESSCKEVSFDVSDNMGASPMPDKSPEDKHSSRQFSDENLEDPSSDTFSFDLLSETSMRSGASSRSSFETDKPSVLDDSFDTSVIDGNFAGVSSTPQVTVRSKPAVNDAIADVLVNRKTRSNLMSKSLNLASLSPKSVAVNRRAGNSLAKSMLTRRSKRSVSVSDIKRVTPRIVITRSSIVPSPPSETSVSTRATYGSGKLSSERSSGESSTEEPSKSFVAVNKSQLDRSRKSSRNSGRRSSRIPVASAASLPEKSKSPPSISKFAKKKSYVESVASPPLSSNVSEKSSDVASIADTPDLSEISRASNSITYSFVDSSLDGSLPESFTRRSVRKTRPSIDESIYDVSKPTKSNSSRRKSNDTSLTAYNICRLMRTPGELKSPILEGVDDIFKTPRPKDPTDITATEATFYEFLKTPHVSQRPKDERLVSPNKIENDPTDITGLRRLLKTPRTPIITKNNKSKVSSVENLRKTPKMHNSSKNDQNKIEKQNDLTDERVVEKCSETPKMVDSPRCALGVETTVTKSQISPKNDIENLTENERLVKISKVQSPSKSDFENITGIGKFFKTPKVRRSPRNDLTNVAGVKKLMKTPKVQNSPRNDLTNIAGVKKLMTTSKAYTSPKNDLSLIAGVKKLMTTPKVRSSPKNDLTKVAGLKKLLKTPKRQNSPRNDLTGVAGVKKLLKTPKPQNSPRNDLTNVAGVKKLLKTPKRQNSPTNDLTHVIGLKKLMTTPKVQSSPKNDLTNVAGVKKLLRTPRDRSSPRNDLTHIVGVKKLMTTPKIQNSPRSDLTNVAGVKKLLTTPKVQNSPKNDLTNIIGLKKLVATPKQQNSPRNHLSDVRGVKRLLTSPKDPKNKLSKNNSFELSGIDILFNESMDKIFDSLIDKKPLRTYSKSPKKLGESSENVAESRTFVDAQKMIHGSSRSKRGQNRLYDPTLELEAKINILDENAEATLMDIALNETGTKLRKCKKNENFGSDDTKINDSKTKAKARKAKYIEKKAEISVADEQINKLYIKTRRGKKVAEPETNDTSLDSKSRTNAKKIVEKNSENSVSDPVDNEMEAKTCLGRKETKKGTLGGTERSNVSLDENSKMTAKTRRPKAVVQENLENSVTAVEVKKVEAKTRAGQKKMQEKRVDETETNDVSLNISTTKGETKRADDIFQNNTGKIVTDVEINEVEPKTRMGKKKTKKTTVDATEKSDVSVDSKTKAKTRRAKAIIQEDNTTDVEDNKVETKTRKGKKETKNTKVDVTETCDVSLDDNSATKRTTRRAKNVVTDNNEQSLTNVTVNEVEAKTRIGKKEKIKRTVNPTETSDVCLANNNSGTKATTTRVKDILQNNNEAIVNNQMEKFESKTRRGKRTVKETKNEDLVHDFTSDQKTETNSNKKLDDEKMESKTRGVKNDVSEDELKTDDVTNKKTRSNRGKNRKYDEVEWDTPVKSTINKIKKNVTFAKNTKKDSPVKVVESPEGLRRSKRTKKGAN